ncbi:hypothetical protein YC2023_110063 [Brassica napus]
MHRFNAFHNQLGNPNSNICTLNIIRLENDFYDLVSLNYASGSFDGMVSHLVQDVKDKETLV